MTEQALDMTAAALEGLAPMPDDLIPLRTRRLALMKRRDKLDEELDQIRDEFAERLEEDNLQGFILDGKVRARRSEVHNTRLDTKAIKAELPDVFAKYSKVTKSVRINIT